MGRHSNASSQERNALDCPTRFDAIHVAVHKRFAHCSQLYKFRWLRAKEQSQDHAVGRALAVRRSPAGLVVHSDQGSQYTAIRFKALLTRHGAMANMSRRSNCYENAHVESLWIRFKAELFVGGSLPGQDNAKHETSHHVAYYNAERRYSALGYQSPKHYENHL